MKSLYQTVKEILDSGRIGVPVFMRCVVQVSPESEHMVSVLAKMLAMACSWLEASPLEVYAQSKDGSGQISVTVQYVDGKTSIVSVKVTPGATLSVDLMLLGNKGALYHDADALAPGFDITAVPVPVPDWLMDAVGHSLNSGEPMVIEEVLEFE